MSDHPIEVILTGQAEPKFRVENGAVVVNVRAGETIDDALDRAFSPPVSLADIFKLSAVDG